MGMIIIRILLFHKLIRIMDIHHDKKNQRVWTELNGYTAEVRYELTDGTVDIFHTYVPEPLGGQGIASKLVEYVYNYSREEGLQITATCSYAAIWLKRHHIDK
jgi:predicted GNAT family acetyltransferase